MLAATFKEQARRPPHRPLVERLLLFVEQRLKPLEPVVHHPLFDLSVHRRGGGAGTARIFEAVGHRILRGADDGERRLEIRFALARKADDEVAGDRDVGPRGADALDDPQIGFDAMAAVHRREDAIAARLHRQVEKGHQLVDLAMRGDQPVGHVVRMAGRIADAFEPVLLRQFADQPVEPDRAPPLVLAVPRVDILAEQRDLPHPARDQRARFGDQVREGPARLGAARVGHDAIGAEFVATLLHGQESGRALAAGALRQRAELAVERHVEVDRLLAPLGAGDQVGQAVIGLRTDDDIDARRAARDLRPFGLRDAARDRDRRTAAVLALQPADIRINLLGRLFADVAGVEDDEVGVGALSGGGIAPGLQHLGHALAVIDVHLAAEGFDAKGLAGTRDRLAGGRVECHRRAIGDAVPSRKGAPFPCTRRSRCAPPRPAACGRSPSRRAADRDSGWSAQPGAAARASA